MKLYVSYYTVQFGTIGSGLESAVTVLHTVIQSMYNESIKSSHDCTSSLAPIPHRPDSTYTSVSYQYRCQFNIHLSSCRLVLYGALCRQQAVHKHSRLQAIISQTIEISVPMYCYYYYYY